MVDGGWRQVNIVGTRPAVSALPTNNRIQKTGLVGGHGRPCPYEDAPPFSYDARLLALLASLNLVLEALNLVLEALKLLQWFQLTLQWFQLSLQ